MSSTIPITVQRTTFTQAGLPIISVDGKKKELIGNFKQAGRTWRQEAEAVNVHDFLADSQGRAVPYGVYDITHNQGFVAVGSSGDTAAFAVDAIAAWWDGPGYQAFPTADQVLILADGGGSNGSRVRLWKVALQALADETDLQITVCHLPPGTSKWNKIEHRLFAHISMNWRGRPLVSHEVIMELIGATTTRTGLTVHAVRDLGSYPTKIKVSDEELAAIHLQPHAFHAAWNYTISPTDAMA